MPLAGLIEQGAAPCGCARELLERRTPKNGTRLVWKAPRPTCYPFITVKLTNLRSMKIRARAAEPHHVVADVGRKVVRILHRQSEDFAFGGNRGTHGTLHFGEPF